MLKNNELKTDLLKMLNYLYNCNEDLFLGSYISVITVWKHDYFISIIFKCQNLKTGNYRIE